MDPQRKKKNTPVLPSDTCRQTHMMNRVIEKRLIMSETERIFYQFKKGNQLIAISFERNLILISDIPTDQRFPWCSFRLSHCIIHTLALQGCNSSLQSNWRFLTLKDVQVNYQTTGCRAHMQKQPKTSFSDIVESSALIWLCKQHNSMLLEEISQ